MKKTLIFGIGLALTATLIITSLAMARSVGITERGQLRNPDCPVVSNLTEEQQQELSRITRDYRDWIYPKKQQMIARQAELNALLATEGADPAEIEQARKDLAGLNQEIFEGKLDHRIKMSQEYNINTGIQGRVRGGKSFSEFGRSARQHSPRYSR